MSNNQICAGTEEKTLDEHGKVSNLHVFITVHSGLLNVTPNQISYLHTPSIHSALVGLSTQATWLCRLHLNWKPTQVKVKTQANQVSAISRGLPNLWQEKSIFSAWL